jgi:deoxyribodipyrimidine photo-lyase
MDTAIVFFTRDLRVHDNPALAAACEQARMVIPVFVVDNTLTAASPNRTQFLLGSLADLRQGLRELGGDLVVRQGDPVAEILRLAGQTGTQRIYVADDVSRYARRRHARLERECASRRVDLVVTPGPAVVPPGDVRPQGGDHYKVFTPYWRAWSQAGWRKTVAAPRVVRLPSSLRIGRIPPYGAGSSPQLAPAGEGAGRRRARNWLRSSLASYGDRHDDLAGDDTSRLSAYLRFGCVSALALAQWATGKPGGEEFCRQLAWRDFFYQVTAAFPDMARQDYRPRGRSWHDDSGALEAWREGRTGVPIVDAGLRQLAAEGFMHNRARMITASFLTKNLHIDWRHGYRHFDTLLADGDVANNAGNWQWVAGTGNDTRPNRVLNPIRQARRFDPDGSYVRRYVPELADLTEHIHTPWRLPPGLLRHLSYPAPIVDPVWA